MHFVDVTHRDQVESPITDWLREAFDYQDQAPTKSVPPGPKPRVEALHQPQGPGAPEGEAKGQAPPPRENQRTRTRSNGTEHSGTGTGHWALGSTPHGGSPYPSCAVLN